MSPETLRSLKGRSWPLSATTYRLLGEEAAYPRQRGFEPVEQEQKVLQFVETDGRVTPAEAEGLCKLSPTRPYRLLQRLSKGDCVTRRRTKKGAWFERRA